MMVIDKPKNPNYTATVVELQKFVDLANCDRLKGALIFGNHVIVGKDTAAGSIGLFFPVETQLLPEFLANNNLYRKPEFGNMDPTKTGFFEEHGRVKAVKFRGHKSEGFWIPLESLSYLGIPLSEFAVGMTFDCVGDHPICKKYIPRHRSRVGSGATVKAAKVRVEDRIVEGQFRLHPDTENLRRNIWKVNPEDWISISDKWHGSSAVYSHILIQRQLNWFERILKRLGVRVQEQEYGFTWSSRRVIKGVNDALPGKQHYYSEDIWGVVAKEVRDRIPAGYTVYGEIVGYTTDGAPIQKGYHYGCQPRQHRLLVYRVTCTNVEGKALELPWLQMKQFCERYGFEMVQELFYGRAVDLCSRGFGEPVEEWKDTFLKHLEYSFVNDSLCPHNNREVPAEGIVLRIDRLDCCESFKLKNWRFLEAETKALDRGEVDVETVESEEQQDV